RRRHLRLLRPTVRTSVPMMGLYYLNGVNHFQYGNSIKGTLTPAGTGSLPDISCYSGQTPPFWNIPDHYPPIGPPNAAGSYSNPAALRFLYGVGLATCNDTSAINSIAEPINEPGSLNILSCHYRKAQSHFEIVISSQGADLFLMVEVFSLTGIKLVEKSFKTSSGLNHLSLPYHNASPGLYIARVSLGGVSKQAKVMVF
ncbi:MAG: T9SS type A sorting domain-containing protein, partial [Bacteroidales bacterium]